MVAIPLADGGRGRFLIFIPLSSEKTYFKN